MIPQPETALAAGDEIVALARVESEAALRDAVVGGVGTGTTEGASDPPSGHGRVGQAAQPANSSRGLTIRTSPRCSPSTPSTTTRLPSDGPPIPRRPMNTATTSPVPSEQDLQRLLAFERQDRHPPDHAGDPNRLTQRRVGDPHGALDRVRPPTDLGGQAGLVALVQTIEEATQDAHVRTWALPPPGAA